MTALEKIKEEIVEQECKNDEHIVTDSSRLLKEYLLKNVHVLIVSSIKEDKCSITEYYTPMHSKKYIPQVLESDSIRQVISDLNKKYEPAVIDIDFNMWGVICIDIKLKDNIFEKLLRKILE